MSSLCDVIGGADLYGGVNYSFVKDRFNNPNEAIYMNEGYLKAPQHYYFYRDSTLTAWIQLKSYKNWYRAIDFGTKSVPTVIAIQGLTGESEGKTFVELGSEFKNLTFDKLIKLDE